MRKANDRAEKNIPVSPLFPASPVRLLGKIPASQLIDGWKTSLAIDISDEMEGVGEIFLHRCQESQIDFFTPVELEGTERLYESLRKFEWYYMADKWEFAVALRDLGRSRRILEVGSGPGLFVERAMKELKGATIKGLDLNEEAVSQARRKNLPVERLEVRDLALRGETFDAVCAFQVLEHLSRPREFLEALIQVLAPAGTLILSVPNRDSFLRHQYNLLDMPPHHMTRWNDNAFAYLPRLFPLKLLALRFEPLAPHHIPGYVDAYGQSWRARSPFLRRFLSERRLRRIADLLRQKGLHRFLRGQSLYGVFQKI
jgi:SAM-dependent methyltransferase